MPVVELLRVAKLSLFTRNRRDELCIRISLTADKRPKDLFDDMMCRKQSKLFLVSELWLLFYCEHVK